MESPASPLSDMESDDFPEDAPNSERSASVSPFPEPRPNKRQRVSGAKRSSTAAQVASAAAQAAAAEAKAKENPNEVTAFGVEHIPLDDGGMSSDTEGSVPGSPHLREKAGFVDDDDAVDGREQVSVCKWDGCDAGDQGNMDLLVKHLHEDHIHARQKRYSCEWLDCPRKGHPHASGYALRAHMRSHTREKPFYCTLPECDRSFTRSDALAKHMRTVHETEALRPSDPVPKHHSSNPLNKVQRIRLVIKDGADGKGSRQLLSADHLTTPGSPTVMTPADIEYESSHATFTRVLVGGAGGADDAASGSGSAPDGDWAVHLPADVAFDADELELPPAQLYALLRKQLEWASSHADGLRAESEGLEEERRAEWVAKELVLEEMIDRANMQLDKEVFEPPPPKKMGDEDETRVKQEDGAMEVDMDKEKEKEMENDVVVEKRKGKEKWKGKEKKKESESEAAKQRENDKGDEGHDKESSGQAKLGGFPPVPYLKEDSDMLDAVVNGGESKDDQ